MLSENSENTGGHDVDALLASIEPGGREIPMHDPAPKVEQAPAPAKEEFELDWKGQKIKADKDKVLKWAQQGYDYNQNISQFKNEKESFLKEKSEWEKSWSPYKEIDEFAKSNQDWWNHVNQSYQQRMQPQLNIPEEVKQYLDPIVKDYSEVKSFINNYQKSVLEQQAKEQDAKLDTEIKSLAKNYNLDFSAKDESGQTLEQKVLNFAQERGFQTFEDAFKVYYHDSLVKIAEARGKEAVMNEIKKRREMGLLGNTTPAPVKDVVSNSGSPRGRNWAQVQQDVFREFNIS